MYFLFAFGDCENDWNTGGMDNYKGSFTSLEAAKQKFEESEDVFGQIATQTETDYGLILLCRYQRSSSSHPDMNCWVDVNIETL